MIRSVKNKPEGKPCAFPKLMTDGEGLIVLFSKSNAGTVVFDNGLSPFAIGHFSDLWVPAAFSDYPQAITLENA